MLRTVLTEGNKDRQLLPDGVAVMFKDCVSLAVYGTIGVLFADGQSSWRPYGSGILIAKVNGLGHRIGHRIVLPCGESVELAVALPRAA